MGAGRFNDFLMDGSNSFQQDVEESKRIVLRYLGTKKGLDAEESKFMNILGQRRIIG